MSSLKFYLKKNGKSSVIIMQKKFGLDIFLLYQSGIKNGKRGLYSALWKKIFCLVYYAVFFSVFAL